MAVNRDNPSVQKILDAAAERFGASGYHGTSLREIAERAGVSKALIHYHFENKESLLLELESYLYREIADEVRQIALVQEPGVETAMGALDRLAASMHRFAPLVPVFVELGSVAMQREELKEPDASFMQEAQQLIVGGIHQTLGQSVSKLVIPPERLASLLLACLHGIALSGAQLGDDATVERFEDLKTLLRNGVFGESTPESRISAPSDESSREAIGDEP